nr:O-antigen ligase family protein [Bacteroidota bacterium]
MTIPSWINRNNVYLSGMVLMLIALPLSKYVMSMAQLLMVANWLFDPKLIQKFRDFFRNRTAVVIVSLFLLHVIGLLWTSDFDYAIKDLRTKVPILALPVIVSTSPKISRKAFYNMMMVYLFANVAGSLVSVRELLIKDITDVRYISLFISHIRFSLNICVAIFTGLWLVFGAENRKPWLKILVGLFTVWLVVFLVILEAVTGLMILLITTGLLLIIVIWKSKQVVLRTAMILVISVSVALVFFFLRNIYLETLPNEPFYHDQVDAFTAQGNPYLFDSSMIVTENGYWVGQYIQVGELCESWNIRSAYKYDGLNKPGGPIRFTLIRFLTSKGLRKDTEGVNALSEEEIAAIENGISNVDYMLKTSLRNRIKTILWEFQVLQQSGYISGHSVSQRIEFWRAASRIITKNILIGTGTGDINKAFQQEYVEMNTTLDPKFRWRTHNQYLSIFAALGLLGLIWFLFVLFYPGFVKNMYGDYFYFLFFGILALSMLSEDTIESQAGVTFYAFFTTFFLFARKEKNKLF